MKKLEEAPVLIDAENLAKGILALMREESEDNELLIKFGMLPAKWMEMIDKMLREKFLGMSVKLADLLEGFEDFLLSKGDLDKRVMSIGGVPHEFDIDKLVSEAVHEVALALYGAVEMVV